MRGTIAPTYGRSYSGGVAPGAQSTLAIRLTIMIVAVLGIFGVLSVWLFEVVAGSAVQRASSSGYGVVSASQLNGLTVFSARCVGSLVLSLVLLIAQVVFVFAFSQRSWWKWWNPLALEVVVGVLFAVATAQAVGGISGSCGATVSSCALTWPPLAPARWMIVCGSFGLVLGGVWSFKVKKSMAVTAVNA